MPRHSVSQGRRLRRPTVSVRDMNNNNKETVVRTRQKREEILRPKPQEQPQQQSQPQQSNTNATATTQRTTTSSNTTSSEHVSE